MLARAFAGDFSRRAAGAGAQMFLRGKRPGRPGCDMGRFSRRDEAEGGGGSAASARGDRDACAVDGCGEQAQRHISRGKAGAALPEHRLGGRGASVGLCRKHYREYKKATKEERDLDRQSW